MNFQKAFWFVNNVSDNTFLEDCSNVPYVCNNVYVDDSGNDVSVHNNACDVYGIYGHNAYYDHYNQSLYEMDDDHNLACHKHRRRNYYSKKTTKQACLHKQIT